MSFEQPTFKKNPKKEILIENTTEPEKITFEKIPLPFRKRMKEIFSKAARYISIVAILNFPFLIHPKPSEDKSLEEFNALKSQAKIELKTERITKKQRGAYRLANELIYKEITPMHYGPAYELKDVPRRLIFGRDTASAAKEDAWRMYLGKPQANNSFGISDYKPSISKENHYYYKINRFIFPDYVAHTPDKNEIKLVEVENIKSVLKEIRNDPHHKVFAGDNETDVMGIFSVTEGRDEQGSYISYYDVWDLDVFPEKEGGFFGKPLEIYDRIYYNPETFQPISEEFKNMFKGWFERQIEENLKK